MYKLLSLLFFIPITTLAQSFKLDPDTPPNERNVPYYMLDTVLQSANSKSQLFSNAMAYINNSSKDGQSVISMADPELGEIAFKGYASKDFNKVTKGKHGKETTSNETAKVYFKCRLYLKDNKFKIVLGSLEYPFSNAMDTGVFMPVTLKETTIENNQFGLVVAMSFIKELSNKLNRKPENDF